MTREGGDALIFRLQLDGREGSSLFTAASGGGSENVVTTVRGLEDSEERKSPGALEFNDITLRRAIDPDRTLWDWRQQVVDGQVDDARCSGTLEIVDSMSAVIVSYAFDRGWPSKYKPICMIDGEDQATAEEITIVVENFRREEAF